MSEEQKYYTVIIDALIPAKLTYNILAESPESALELAKTKHPTQPPQFNFSQIRRLVGKVYDMGTVMLRHTRHF